MLGITEATLSRYISAGKIAQPKTVHLGKFRVHAWTKTEVEHARQRLPEIANGRKTRWQRQKAQAKAPVPHKKRQTKKKKES